MRRFLTRFPEGGGQLLVPPPTQNLQIWMDGRKGITVSAGTVTRWADQSGNGRDFTPVLASFPATYSPAATPRGVDALLMQNSPYGGMENPALPAYDVSQGLSQYWLGRVKGTPGTCSGAVNWPSGNGTLLVLNKTNTCAAAALPNNHDCWTGNSYVGDFRATVSNEWVQYALVIQGSLAASSWINGVKVGTGNLAAVTASNHIVMSTNSIGGPPNIQFQCASYLMYNHGHSDAIAAQIAQWQTITYGIGVN